MKYYIIAGEASGDLHGSNLIKEIKKLDAQAKIRCWGGDMMETAGGQVVRHYKDLAFMGFIEVIKNLPAILKNLKFCKQDIIQFHPDVLILIDYPGFNLRIAKWAKEHKLQVVYYISPQVWAWKEGRVKSIKKWVDKMLVILPFEKEFYHKWNYEVEYVGHPLVQVIMEFKRGEQTHAPVKYANEARQQNLHPGKEVIVLLPGSRKQEIAVKLPIMLEASKSFSQYRFIIAQAPSVNYSTYEEIIRPYPNVDIAIPGQTYLLLNSAKAALVTSGTATLETALFGVPQVVCYKGSAISYHIARRLVKIKYISLVNLIMDKPVVKELIQNELTVTNITNELQQLLTNTEKINQVKEDYAALERLLQQDGDASYRAAQAIVSFLRPTS